MACHTTKQQLACTHVTVPPDNEEIGLERAGFSQQRLADRARADTKLTHGCLHTMPYQMTGQVFRVRALLPNGTIIFFIAIYVPLTNCSTSECIHHRH